MDDIMRLYLGNKRGDSWAITIVLNKEEKIYRTVDTRTEKSDESKTIIGNWFNYSSKKDIMIDENLPKVRDILVEYFENSVKLFVGYVIDDPTHDIMIHHSLWDKRQILEKLQLQRICMIIHGALLITNFNKYLINIIAEYSYPNRP